MSLQAKFRAFDEAIKLRRFDENAELREKRDRVLTRLREGLQRQFPSTLSRPTFEPFNQGSYHMSTGVKPLDGDYDIDVGLVFNIDISRFPDPVGVKEWVYGAVKEHTTDVRFRRPCITVYYVQGREPKYHVDLAVYGKDGWGGLHLAIGKQNASADQRRWMRSEPKKLTEIVDARFSGEDADQFRRVIRYLKRWKDHRFSALGAAAPTGIALTACALNWFAVQKSSPGYYYGAEPATYDDLLALAGLVAQIRANFQWCNTSGGSGERLKVVLPVPPGNDLFEKMTNQQMLEVRQQLDELLGVLRAARATDEHAASQVLRRCFGDDFPT